MQRDGVFPGDLAYMVSPMFDNQNSHRCVTFNFHAYGSHVGGIAILDKDGNDLWRHVGNPFIGITKCCSYKSVNVEF